MEILDSGVEIEPGEEQKIKGGACACACWQPEHNNSSISAPAHLFDVCICDCIEHDQDLYEFLDDSDSTVRYIY